MTFWCCRVGSLFSSNASSKASSIFSTKWMNNSFLTSSGISETSSLFFIGKITFLILLRWAAIHFSFIPPTGSTNPYKLSSPVIAKSYFTRLPVKSDTMATVIVTPADGPSLGVDAAGKWTCKSNYFIRRSSSLLFSLTTLTAGVLTRPNYHIFALIQLKPVTIDSFITSPN